MSREGLTGTQDLRKRRTVQRGGRIRYNHEWWYDPALEHYIGIEVLVHDYAFLGTIDVYECWYPRGTNRRAFKFLRSNRPLWQQGPMIAADVRPVQQDPQPDPRTLAEIFREDDE